MCHYLTDDISHYKRHIKTKKHLHNSATDVPEKIAKKLSEIKNINWTPVRQNAPENGI